MHPIARDEIFLIGREAIRNAFRHSRGTRVDVYLKYGRGLTMRIRDDGMGMHPEFAVMGRAGHFGLSGMKERAGRIGGKLTLVSSGTGTEIELNVPGRGVFRNGGLLSRFFGTKSSH
jgi:signal transduction histidine kinase